MDESGQLDAPATLPTGERASGTHWMGAVLQAVYNAMNNELERMLKNAVVAHFEFSGGTEQNNKKPLSI
jgi:hypothetical protein